MEWVGGDILEIDLEYRIKRDAFERLFWERAGGERRQLLVRSGMSS